MLLVIFTGYYQQHPQAVEDPHECRVHVLIAQDDVDQATNRASDAQLKADESLERAAQAANEILQPN